MQAGFRLISCMFPVWACDYMLTKTGSVKYNVAGGQFTWHTRCEIVVRFVDITGIIDVNG